MKIEREYIYFLEKPRPESRKTRIFGIHNKRSGTELGIVRWHGPWRQYCYFPTVQAVYSAGCLEDIATFMRDLRKNEIAEAQVAAAVPRA